MCRPLSKNALAVLLSLVERVPNTAGDFELAVRGAHDRRDAVARHFRLARLDGEVLVVFEVVVRGDREGDAGGDDHARDVGLSVQETQFDAGSTR